MTKLPDCPICSEPDLWLEVMLDAFRLRCRECGWNSGIVKLADDAVLDDAIAATAVAAREAHQPIDDHSQLR